ncbi:F-type H+-transporting ATPase subunit epsilon [Elusimicrobium posterum]|uniref:ATP synthase F1 subunit epsilon n=1 Tax=Elusimicrobium posterum TaxID=3116653 RepID=UPI003C767AC8
MKKTLKLTILTPEKPIVEEKEVDFVAVPAYEGEMGFLPGHLNIVAQLKAGTVHYKYGGQEEKFDVLGGFVEVYEGEVEVFAESAALAAQMSEEERRQEIAKAKKTLSGKGADIDFELAEMELKAELMQLKSGVRFKKKHERNI